MQGTPTTGAVLTIFPGELLPPVKLPMHAHAPFSGELLPPVKLPVLVHACSCLRACTCPISGGSFCRRLNCPCMHMPHFGGSFCRRLNCPCLCMRVYALTHLRMPCASTCINFRGSFCHRLNCPCMHMSHFGGSFCRWLNCPCLCMRACECRVHAHAPFRGSFCRRLNCPCTVNVCVRMPCASTRINFRGSFCRRLNCPCARAPVYCLQLHVHAFVRAFLQMQYK
jgi:hypothetical protein